MPEEWSWLQMDACRREMITDLIITESCEESDISAYRLARFDERELMQSVFGIGFQG